MPAMKVTPDAAMRARDVSRPRTEHLAWAEEAEASAADAAGVAVTVRAGGPAGNNAATGENVTAGADENVETEFVVKTEVVVEADVTDGSHRRRIRGTRSSRRGRRSR